MALWDSMLGAYVLKAGDVGDFKKLLKEYLDIEHPEFASAEELYQSHLKLEAHLKREILNQGLEHVLAEYEVPLVPVLFRMEKKGILIDQEFLFKQSKELAKEIATL